LRQQFSGGIGLAGADRRAVFEQLSQDIGAIYPVGGFVSRNRSGSDGQKQQCDRGEFHFFVTTVFVTTGGLSSLQAGPGPVHSFPC